jgi:hypothetical protein
MEDQLVNLNVDGRPAAAMLLRPTNLIMRLELL